MRRNLCLRGGEFITCPGAFGSLDVGLDAWSSCQQCVLTARRKRRQVLRTSSPDAITFMASSIEVGGHSCQRD